MSVQLARRQINVEEYYRMAEVGILTDNDHVELIHGEIIEMSPIGSRHASIVNRITKILTGLVGDSAIVSVQNPIKVNDLNEPEPDVAVLKPRDDFYAEKHPGSQDIFLVIEISDTTLAYDREIKLPLYAMAGIPEFWLINLEKGEIEIHRVPSTDVYKKIEILRPGDQMAMPGFDVVLDAGLLLG